MTAREMRRLDSWQRRAAVRAAAAALDGALNLLGDETVDELLEASGDGADALERYLGQIMTAECDDRRGTCQHSFPLWFVREATPLANRLRRIARQYRAAEAAA